MIVRSDDLATTQKIAEHLAEAVYESRATWSPNLAKVICLEGDLGAGKTVFSRSFIQHIARLENQAIPNVPSPTYCLLNEYMFSMPIVHMDCYRLTNELELEALGVQDMLSQNATVLLVEWASRVGEDFFRQSLNIHFSLCSKGIELQFEVSKTKFLSDDESILWLEYLKKQCASFSP